MRTRSAAVAAAAAAAAAVSHAVFELGADVSVCQRAAIGPSYGGIGKIDRIQEGQAGPTYSVKFTIGGHREHRIHPSDIQNMLWQAAR
jgi:hypothetical protein